MTDQQEKQKPQVQASDHSVAVNSVDIGGSVGRDFIIAHSIGYTPEEVARIIAQISTTFQPKPFDGKCPYKGLDVFEEQDASLFFGREELVQDLVSRLQQSRAVFVTGPSGCGKSSLVRAGLIPACKAGGIEKLHSANWYYDTIKPGREPLEALALMFSRLKTPALAQYFRDNLTSTSILNACIESVLSEREDQRFVLFIDQFEEIFTQINREEDRLTFLQVLTDALAVENGRVLIVFSMRSDFVSNCATYPALNQLLNQHAAFAQIGAMQRRELVSAIAQPALRVGLRIDPDLISQIISDMQGEPGALPLMQFALKDLFTAEQSAGGVIALTLAKYQERGGIHKSLERHANEAFNTLAPNEQDLARTIFSSLIEIGRGTPDTGRTALFDELIPAAAKAEDVKTIVNKLADARLITTDEQGGQDMITISHEALIDAWPWLRKLVNENRDVIALQNEIAGDAKEWDQHQRDESYLYTGARLANAREKLDANKLMLSGLSQLYLEAGIQAHTDELEAVKQRAAHLRQRNLFLRVALGFALITLIVAVNFGSMAYTRQLAAQARVLQDDRRDLALLMSVQAFKLSDNFETRSSLLSSVQCCADALIAFLPGHQDSVWDVAFSPDSSLLATSSTDGTIRIWDVETHRQVRTLARSSTAPVYTLAFSPTENVLAAGDGTSVITLYDTRTWEPIGSPLDGHESSVLSVRFSRDGTLLVSTGTDGMVNVWDVQDQTLKQQLAGHTNWVWDADISPDNKTVASVGSIKDIGDPTLFLWSLDAPDKTVSLAYGSLVSVAFANQPYSRVLVTGDASGYVTLWNLAPWRIAYRKPLPSSRLGAGIGTSGRVWGLTISPGPELEIITSRDTGYLNRNRILLNDFSKHWDKNSRTFVNGFTLERESLGLTANNFGFFRVDISPDGQYIAVGGQDGLVSLWQAKESSAVIRHPQSMKSLQIVNGAESLAMSIDGEGKLYHWDYDKQEVLSQHTLDSEPIFKSAISSDGTRVVTATEAGVLTLWNGKDGSRIFEVKEPQGLILSLAFRPDGAQIASSDDKGQVKLWDVQADGLRLARQFTDPKEAPIRVLLFSPDGSTLVGGGCGFPITFPSPDCSQGIVYEWDSNLRPILPVIAGKSGNTWSLAFNPSAPNELAVGTRDGTVTIWDLNTHQERVSVRLGKSDVSALAFSPDGKLLAVGADTYKIFLYDPLTGQKLGTAFREHDGNVTALSFAPDGQTLLSASVDHTVVIHSLNPHDWQADACRIANHNLSAVEWKRYITRWLPALKICPQYPIEEE